MFPRMSLAAQFAGLVVVVAVTVGTVVGLATVSRSREAVLENVRREQLAAVEMASMVVVNHVEAIKLATGIFGERLDREVEDHGDDAAVRLATQRFLSEHRGVETLAVYRAGGDPAGNPVAGTDRGGSYASESWFRATLATGEPGLGPPRVSVATGRPVVPYAAPLLGDRGERAGVVVATISLDTLRDELGAVRNPESQIAVIDVDTWTFLVNDSAAMVLRPIPVPRYFTIEPGIVRRATTEFAVGPSVMLAATRSIPELRWSTSVQTPKAVALAPIEGMVASIVRWIVLAVVAAGLLGTALAFWIVRPLAQLERAAQAIARGDLSVRAGTGRRDEIGDLARAFDEMAARQQATIEKLRAHSRDSDRARALTDAVVNSTAEAFVLIAPDGQVTLANRRVGELLGPKVAACRSAPDFFAVVDEVFEDPAAMAAFMREMVDRPDETVRTVVALRSPEQTELAVYATAVALPSGEPLGQLVSYRDVTRERAVDRMKTEFISLVSHELRTPLTSIKGYADLLVNGEAGELSEDQGEFVGTIKRNADRLVNLIGDVLDVARIESGKVELHAGYVDLAELVRGSVNALRPLVEAKKQVLTLELPADLPPVWADADRVEQIVTNLLSNAHKYTPIGGAIGVAIGRELGVTRVSIEDSGIGLSAEEQTKLFTKFFRAENRTTQEVGGTGLGLAITKSLVEMHGGEVTVTSTPGEGSTFSFTLPDSLEPAGSPSASNVVPIARIPAPASGASRILVVEDDPDIAGLIGRYLGHGGYDVLLARDGHEAFEVARCERPDLITLDVVLPGVDGLTVLEWLHTDPATAAIPVMLLSMMPDDGRGRLLGAVDYLPKPIEERSLRERVATILSGRERGLVLLADDDADVRAMLARHLRNAGYRVAEAADGAEAVALAEAELPDLALLDVRMPGTDGIAALAALRANPRTRALPIVMMTASPGAMAGSRSAIAALGASALLTKPCTPDEVAHAISIGLEARSRAGGTSVPSGPAFPAVPSGDVAAA